MQMIFSKLRFCVLLLPLMSSCITHSGDMDPKHESDSLLERKQAELWIRVDELESLVLKQSDQIALLEKNFLSARSEPKENKIASEPSEHPSISLYTPKTEDRTEKKITADTPAKKIQKKKNPKQDYASKMEKAKNLFDRGIWHKAFLAFSEIEREEDPGLSKGEPIYWIGRCWFHMKEYQSAQTIFARFVQNHPDNSLQPSARLFLARTELALGDHQTALASLQDLIKRFPTDESSAIAKVLLNNSNEGKL